MRDYYIVLSKITLLYEYFLMESYAYSAAINASSSAALTAASSSCLDKAAPPFLSFAYHDRSLPFCHRPTGAIKELPGNNIKELILDVEDDRIDVGRDIRMCRFKHFQSKNIQSVPSYAASVL